MTAKVKRIALGVGASLLALGVSAGVYASAGYTNQDPPPFRGGPMGMLPMFGPEIGLTDAQRDQIKAIAQAHNDEWKALGDRARTAHEALNDAITADTIDDGAIRQKSAEVAAIDADMAVARAHAHAEVFQILTPEQKTQVKKIQAEMKSRMKNRQAGRRGRLLERFGL